MKTNESRRQWWFTLLLSIATTCFVSFILVMLTMGFRHGFVSTWIQSWLTSALLVSVSILYLVPFISRLRQKRKGK